MWSDEDTEYALEWQRLEREKCAGCGLPQQDTLDLPNVNRWKTVLHWCDGCKARDHAAKAHADNGGESSGMKIALRDTFTEGD